MLPAGVILLLVCNAHLIDFAAFAILFLCLVAIEALNTAIECVVDHLAPNWEEFARDVKDLGSLATMCLLFAHGVFFANTLLNAAF